jgi:hypothetical protein
MVWLANIFYFLIVIKANVLANMLAIIEASMLITVLAVTKLAAFVAERGKLLYN